MSYDPTSPQAKKGAIGEQIVAEILERWGSRVMRPDNAAEDEARLVDFYVSPDNTYYSDLLAEVKVRKAMPYAFGQYPCYSFPVAQIEAYLEYAKEKRLPLELFIVDPEIKTVLMGELTNKTDISLHNKKFIDGKKFPFDQMTKIGNYRFFHRNQFAQIYPSDYVLTGRFDKAFAEIEALDNEPPEDDKKDLSFFKSRPEAKVYTVARKRSFADKFFGSDNLF